MPFACEVTDDGNWMVTGQMIIDLADRHAAVVTIPVTESLDCCLCFTGRGGVCEHRLPGPAIVPPRDGCTYIAGVNARRPCRREPAGSRS